MLCDFCINVLDIFSNLILCFALIKIYNLCLVFTEKTINRKNSNTETVMRYITLQYLPLYKRKQLTEHLYTADITVTTEFSMNYYYNYF